VYLLLDHKITVKPISHDHIDANKWYVPFGVKITNEIKIIAKKKQKINTTKADMSPIKAWCKIDHFCF